MVNALSSMATFFSVPVLGLLEVQTGRKCRTPFSGRCVCYKHRLKTDGVHLCRRNDLKVSTFTALKLSSNCDGLYEKQPASSDDSYFPC